MKRLNFLPCMLLTMLLSMLTFSRAVAANEAYANQPSWGPEQNSKDFIHSLLWGVYFHFSGTTFPKSKKRFNREMK